MAEYVGGVAVSGWQAVYVVDGGAPGLYLAGYVPVAALVIGSWGDAEGLVPNRQATGFIRASLLPGFIGYDHKDHRIDGRLVQAIIELKMTIEKPNAEQAEIEACGRRVAEYGYEWVDAAGLDDLQRKRLERVYREWLEKSQAHWRDRKMP